MKLFILQFNGDPAKVYLFRAESRPTLREACWQLGIESEYGGEIVSLEDITLNACQLMALHNSTSIYIQEVKCRWVKLVVVSVYTESGKMAIIPCLVRFRGPLTSINKHYYTLLKQLEVDKNVNHNGIVCTEFDVDDTLANKLFNDVDWDTAIKYDLT